MPAPTINKIGGLDQTDLESLQGMAKDAIDSLRNDLASADDKLRAAARKELFNLGVFNTMESDKGVVAFLLERAKKGDFGKKASIFARESVADPNHVDFIVGSAVEDDDPDTVKVIPAQTPPATAFRKPAEKRPVTVEIEAPAEEPEVVEDDDTREKLRQQLLSRHNG